MGDNNGNVRGLPFDSSDMLRKVTGLVEHYLESMPKPPSAIDTTHAEEARLYDSIVLTLVQMGKPIEEAIEGGKAAVKERRTIHL